MADIFNADEAFALAEKMEQNGAAFYRKTADANPEAKAMLEGLAAMEDQHLETFAQMHAEIGPREKEPTAADPDNEAQAYLQAFLQGKVFGVQGDPSDMLTGDESLADILTIAIGLEKDSIAFYLGLKGLMEKKAGKERIEAIIAEEMQHVTLLNAKLNGEG
jgi:rubrerythrin